MSQCSHRAGAFLLGVGFALLAPPLVAGQAGSEDPGARRSVDAPTAVNDDAIEQIEVIGTPRLVTPLPGIGLDESQITTNVQAVSAEDIKKSAAVNATEFLNQQLQSITVSDNSGNPFQQDVNFRGFSASPLIATPQGISVYLDGVRVNESFGDVVNWDLLPLSAIDGLAVVPGSNPLFGLNTIAGALSIATKSGFTAPTLDAMVRVGSWGRRQLEVSTGIHDDNLAAFLTYNRITEDGWRDNSPSEIRQFFGRGDFRDSWLNVSVSALLADNELVGNGTVPVQDFRVDPSRVYTSPDITTNKLTHLNVTATAYLNDQITVSALGYHRKIAQDNESGDFWDDFERGGTAARQGFSCIDFDDPFGGSVPANANGATNVIESGVPGCFPNGVFNNSELDQTTRGASLQLTWVTGSNQLVAGYTYDNNDVEFEQSQLLGFIDADRSIFLDPERPAGDQFVIASIFFPDRIDEARLGFSFPPTSEPIFRNGLTGTSTTQAVFVYDVLTLFDSLNVSAGVRYTRTEVSNDLTADLPVPLWQFERAFIAGRDDICGAPQDPDARFQCTAESFTYNAVNPAFGLSWQVTEEANVFAGVSRGSRVPSSIELACARDEAAEEGLANGKVIGCTIPTGLTNDPFLEQVRSTSYEVGGRGTGPFGVDWNLAVFQTDIENDILFVSLGRGNRGVFDNFGETRRRGLELGLAQETGRFRWFANYTLLKATFESSAVAVNRSNSTASQVIGEPNEFTIDPGDEIPGTPRHALRAGVEFDFTEALTGGLSIIGQSSSFARGNENNEHQPVGTDFNGTPLNTPSGPVEIGRPFVGAGSVSGFVIANLKLSYQATRQVSVTLQVDNIFDKTFATTGNLGLNPFNASINIPAGARDASGFNFNSLNWNHTLFVGPGPPRAAWLSFRYTLDDF